MKPTTMAELIVCNYICLSTQPGLHVSVTGQLHFAVSLVIALWPGFARLSAPVLQLK